MNIYSFEGYIFDLDGTLLDSMGLWNDIYAKVLGEFNIKAPKDYLFNVNHMSLDDGAEYTVKTFHLENVVKKDDIVDMWNAMSKEEYENTVQLKPGARGFLQSLKNCGKLLGVATALSDELFVPCLKRLGISELFSATTSIDEVSRGKEFPDIYLRECKKMGTKPQNTVVFEDSLTGIKSASVGGFKTVGVYDPSAAEQTEEIKNRADLYISSFSEMLYEK